MGNPILMVMNGGFGETLVPAGALLKPGDELNVHNSEDGSQCPAICLALVPVGVSPEIAIADQRGKARPLMLSKPRHREILYVLEWEGRRFQILHGKVKAGIDRAKAAGLTEEVPNG